MLLDLINPYTGKSCVLNTDRIALEDLQLACSRLTGNAKFFYAGKEKCCRIIKKYHDVGKANGRLIAVSTAILS